MTVLDALGVVPKIGDRVAFGQGNKGAHPLLIGTISDVASKSVLIQWERAAHGQWEKQQYPTGWVKEQSRRLNAAFVVLPCGN